MILDPYFPILEDLTLTTRSVLRYIPSHAENLGDVSVDRRTIARIRCMIVERDSLKCKQLPTWATSIEHMFAQMELD